MPAQPTVGHRPRAAEVELIPASHVAIRAAPSRPGALLAGTALPTANTPRRVPHAPSYREPATTMHDASLESQDFRSLPVSEDNLTHAGAGASSSARRRRSGSSSG